MISVLNVFMLFILFGGWKVGVFRIVVGPTGRGVVLEFLPSASNFRVSRANARVWCFLRFENKFYFCEWIFIYR